MVQPDHEPSAKVCMPFCHPATSWYLSQALLPNSTGSHREMFSLLNIISWDAQWDKTCNWLLCNCSLTPLLFRAQHREKGPIFWLQWVLTHSRDGDKIAQKLSPMFYCCFSQVDHFNSISDWLLWKVLLQKSAFPLILLYKVISAFVFHHKQFESLPIPWTKSLYSFW